MANPSKLNPHDRHDEYASESYLRRIKAEIRKTNKPIMEKKRRARINNYLNDLKGLLLDAMKKDPVRHSKLEKADILDLTVKHLQDIERRRLNVAMAVDPTVPEKFATGYRECIDEIGKYFDTLGSVDDGLKARVRKHLESCLTFQPGKPFPVGLGGGQHPFGFAGLPLQSPDDINNNTSTSNGLLNRTFANNLSLMFPAGIPFPTGDTPSIPFHSFPFFGPLRGTTLANSAFPSKEPEMVVRPPGMDTREDRAPSTLTVPSPPASPTNGGDGTGDCSTLKTPLGKTGTLSDHKMERLLSIFPTPPSPEEQSQPSRSRLGKLGHHFHRSPFVPTVARTGANGTEDNHGREDVSMDEGGEHQQEEGECSQGQERKVEEPVDDGKDNPNGEMWRPW